MSNKTFWENNSDFPMNKAFFSRLMDIPKHVRLMAYKNATTVTIKGVNKFPVRVGTETYWLDTDVDVAITADLDTGAEASGTDYYVYICDDGSGVPVFIISANASAPDATWRAAQSITQYRMIGGFHNSPDGDILQYSVWHLNDMPQVYAKAIAGDTNCQLGGMVKSKHLNLWYDIYLINTDGQSINGGTIWDGSNNMSVGLQSDLGGATKLNSVYTCTQLNAMEVASARGKRLLSYQEFSDMALGTPEEKNIFGSADPGTTGGHTTTDDSADGNDRASYAIQSDVGCEDCCGVLNQWGREYSYRSEGGTAWTWKDQATSGNIGNKGALYTQDTYGLIAVLFGGACNRAAYCGSRCSYWGYSPWNVSSSVCVRFACEGI